MADGEAASARDRERPPEAREPGSRADANGRVRPPSSGESVSMPAAGGDGGGQVGPEAMAAIGSITRFAAWVLEWGGRIAVTLADVLRRLAAPVLRIGLWLGSRLLRAAVRRGRPLQRLRIRSRLRSIERAKKRTDREAGRARERVEAHAAAVRENGDARVREAVRRRVARVGEVRGRADRLVAQARRTGETGIRRARWEARALPAAQADARVRAAEQARDRRVDRAERLGSAITDRARASGDAEVARVRSERDRANRAAQARASAALREIGSARTESLADLDRRASEVRDLRGQRLSPRELNSRLRADHRQGREAIRTFRNRVAAAEGSMGPAPAPVRAAPTGTPAPVPVLGTGAVVRNLGVRGLGLRGTARTPGRAVSAPRRSPARVPGPGRRVGGS